MKKLLKNIFHKYDKLPARAEMTFEQYLAGGRK
jgi:hypothetical protein